jgi:hypothetical protein
VFFSFQGLSEATRDISNLDEACEKMAVYFHNLVGMTREALASSIGVEVRFALRPKENENLNSR